MTPTIEARGLRKRFGKGDKGVDALDGLDLTAEPGQVVALLGPNGAGKTTFVRTVATLVSPDAGELQVAGIDVRREPHRVRQVIGLAGQYAAVEPAMTGRENVEMVARLVGQDRRTARANADRVLEQLGLSDAGGEEPTVDEGTRRVTVGVTNGTEELMRALRSLDPLGIELDDVGLRRPTLDEVFLTLTGQPLPEEVPA